MVWSKRSCVAENSASTEEILQRFDSYIIAHTQSLINHYPSLVHRAVPDLEVDEIIQRIRIKFWLMLERGHILYPHAYIKQIIHSELIDACRRHKPVVPLQTDEDGEIDSGNVLVLPGAGMADPLDEVEQQDEVANCMEKTVDAVLQLPNRQRLAMICSLRERVDDLTQLVSAFKARRIDIEGLQWPQERSEKQMLQASLSGARKKVEQYMSSDGSEHDGAGKVPVVQRHKDSSTDENGMPILELLNGELQGEEIKMLLEKLREPYQTAVRLHYIKKQTYPQIASALNLPTGTVKSHISRGMRMLCKLKDMQLLLKRESEQEVVGISELIAHLDTLDEPYQTAVRLHYVEKCACQQIADELDLPKGTVKSHISRGVKRLRSLVQRC